MTNNTWDDIMEVLAWSFQCNAAGIMPKERHDGSAWLPSDSHRSKMAKNSIGLRAALVEVRGDWTMFAEAFRFPQHNLKAGICWKCTCTPAEECCI